jgi:hypothetical protein
LVVGDFALAPAEDPVFAFERIWGDVRILCVFNISNREIMHPIATSWHPMNGHGFDATLVGDQRVLPPFGRGSGSEAWSRNNSSATK